MRIAVLLKEVPDTYSDRDMNLETGLTDRSGDVVADEVGERAVEAALRIVEAAGTTGGDGEHQVDVLTVGPASAADAARRGIAMGANEAFVVTDEALTGADLTLTAQVLAELVRKQGYDLVLTGAMSSDGGGGVIAPMLGELLGWPCLSNLTELNVEATSVRGTQASDGATVQLSAELPAVASVADEFADPRYPNFKGLMAAKKKEVTTFSLADLGIDANDFTHPRAIMVAIERRPARERGEIIDASSTSATQLVDFLESKNLI